MVIVKQIVLWTFPDRPNGPLFRKDAAKRLKAALQGIHGWNGPLSQVVPNVWGKEIQLLLLMEEILHQLISSLSQYLQGFIYIYIHIYPRWCRISSINSSWWFFSTHLKNLLVKFHHFPNFRCGNKTHLSCHHLAMGRVPFQTFQ